MSSIVRKTSGKNITNRLRLFEILDCSPLSRLDAEVLLLQVLGISREQLFAYSDEEVSGEKLSEFHTLEKKRLAGVSVAAIINSKEFFGLDFFVDENVLIPRPETEIIVEEILRLQPQNFLDVGCGSGAIAIAVKKNLPNCEIFASDISGEALEVARKNSKKNEARVQFFESNLLEKLPPRKFEIIAANLPYVPENSVEIEIGVEKFEPHLALFGGVDGLDLIRRLLVQISEFPQRPKFILLEFGGGEQTEILEKFVKKLFPSVKIEFKKDLAGVLRVLKLSHD